jgi:acyl-CoA reductase-like NAD-dependent aldehyde dehydrogenase
MTDPAAEPLSIAHPRQLFIGGEWVEPASANVFNLVNPATEDMFMTVAAAAEADVDKAVAAARHAFDHGPWPRMSPAERASCLNRLADALDQRSRELAHCWTRQMGAPFHSLTLPFTGGGIDFIRMNAALGSEIDWESDRPTIYPNSQGKLVAEPVGVVATIAPWNGPLFLLAVKLAPALIAGCTTVIKPAPETPLEAFILAECVEEVGFPAGVINLIPGNNEVSNYLGCVDGIPDMHF